MEQKYYRFEQTNIPTGKEEKEINRKKQINLSNPCTFPNGFVRYDDIVQDDSPPKKFGFSSSKDVGPDERETLCELEDKLFGIHRQSLQAQRITDLDWIPIKSGIPN